MTRAELVARLCGEDPGLSPDTARQVVDTVLGTMTGALADGRRVELRRFGAFTLRLRPARLGRDPRNGESVAVPERPALRFTPSRRLRARLSRPDPG